MKKFLGGIICMCGMLFISGCSLTQSSSTSDEFSIVTTFGPLYSHTLNVVGDVAKVTNLVPAGTSVHDWQITPSTAKILEEADVIITNGVALEEFLHDRISDLQTQGVLVVDTSEGLTLLATKLSHHHDEHDEKHNENEDKDEKHEGGDDNHEELHDDDKHYDDVEKHDTQTQLYEDPHIWLSVSNAIHQTKIIRNILSQADKDNATIYYDNATNYIQQLETLDNNIKKQLATVEEKKPYILFHDAFNYYLEAYDLEKWKAGIVQEIPGTNPSPQALATLITTIRDQNAAIIFTEPQFNPQVVDTIANETDVIVAQIDPIGAETSANGYIRNMESITTEIVNAMLLTSKALGEERN